MLARVEGSGKTQNSLLLVLLSGLPLEATVHSRVNSPTSINLLKRLPCKVPGTLLGDSCSSQHPRLTMTFCNRNFKGVTTVSQQNWQYGGSYFFNLYLFSFMNYNIKD